jgi:hypothetical protein
MIVVMVVLGILTTSRLVQADDSLLSQYFPLAIGNRWIYEVQDHIDGAPPAEEYWEATREEQGAYALRCKKISSNNQRDEGFTPTSTFLRVFPVSVVNSA